MSVPTYTPEPLKTPRIEGVAIPATFWDDLLSYRPKALARLPVQERDRLDRQTLHRAKREIKDVPFNQNKRYKGEAYALAKVAKAVKVDRRQDIADALKDRSHAVDISRRVPCGARKKTGAQCRAMAEPGRNRCKHHGGRSTGPRTLDGMRRALACLPQYKASPEALDAKLATYADRFV